MWILTLHNTLGETDSYYNDINDAIQALHQSRLNGCNGFIYLDKDLKE